MISEIWNHQTILKTGRYKGTELGKVPASYFIYLNDIFGVDRLSPMGVYITDNIDALRARNEKEKADQKRQKKLNAK